MTADMSTTRKSEGSKRGRRVRPETALAMPEEQWPEIDRHSWREALREADFLEPDKPASRWSPPRRRIGVQTYGQWLRFLAERGELDPDLPPGDRCSDERLRAFVEELVQRVAPASVSMMVGALVRMFTVMAPERDWSTVNRLYRHFKQAAKPSRDKLGTMVPAADLLRLGLHLMDTASEQPPTGRRGALRFRDGLLVAVLICCPVRMANLAAIRIGEHLQFDGSCYRLRFTAAETKTGRPYAATLPELLTPYIDTWLETWRPQMQSFALARAGSGQATNALWLTRDGAPMDSWAIRMQIKDRTKAAFGRPIWPHLFRDISVTELVDLAPEEVGMAADLLGHTSLQTTATHYIKAKGMIAHGRVQEMIAQRRRRSPDSTDGFS